MSCHATMCARQAPSPSTARPNLRIAPPEAETEREADRIADAAMSRSGAASPPAQAILGVIHRQCAACAVGGPACADCAKEETLHLQRGDAAPAATSRNAPQAAAALSGGGRPLPEGLRFYFEPRIGADLSGVRLHTDARVGRAAQGIDARAYTIGRDIGFASGAYAPDSAAGQRLLAHEIAHTLQGEATLLHRQPDEEADEVPEIPSVRTDTHEDRSGGGTTSFEEIVETRPTVEGDRIRGPVRRREIAPATEDEPRQLVADHQTQVEFDTAACEVVLAYRFGFEELEDSPNDNFCQGARMEGAVDLDAIGQNYIDTVNGELNDQFKVRISECESDCSDQDIPIRIEARRDDSDPDRMIRVIPRAGRGASSILCAGESDNPGFPVHEAGHQILGRGDEYPERDRNILEQSPHWGRPERVRHDYSWMASSRHFGRFAVFHQRDFRHVQTFLRVALPGCHVELVGVPQVTVAFRPFIHAGLGVLSGATAGRVGGGIDLGIPLTRGREWSLLLGAQADYLAQLGEDERRFVLAGMGVGLERQFQGREVSGRLFGTGRVGVSHELESTGIGSAPAFGPRTSAFGEGEIGAGVLLHGSQGSAFTADLRLGGGGELSSDEAAAWWFNVGVAIGGRF